MKKLLLLFTLMLCVIISSCSSGPLETTNPTAQTQPQRSPLFQVDISQLISPIYDQEEFRLVMMDTDGTHILYSLNRVVSFPEQMIGYFVTEQVVISNALTGETVCTWFPETPGYYFAGALEGNNAAVLVGELDYYENGPNEYAVYCFGANQKQVFPPVMEVNNFQRLTDDSVIFSFADSVGKNGICQVKNGTCTEVLVMDTDEGQVPYAGSTSRYGTEFSYVMGKDGLLNLIAADSAGIHMQHTLAYQTEKLDSCSMTKNGLLACLSVNEGTTDAHRMLVLYTDSGKTLQLRRGADSALYRMQFGETAGIAVNNNWQLFLIGIGNDHIACKSLQSITDLLDGHDRTRAAIFSTGDGRFVLFFAETNALFLLDVRYS